MVLMLSILHVSLQGKLHDTLEGHLGQLAAEIQSSREQYQRKKLGKRKHEDDDSGFLEVSNATHNACVIAE